MHSTAENRDLPLHPTIRDPRTGEPLRALGVMPSGRICWPIMGGSGEGDGGQGAGQGGQSGQGGAGDGGAGQGAGQGTGQGGGQGSGSGRAEATDANGNPLGFPENTPVAEMSDKQASAYWRNIARKHEGRVNDLTGGRPFEDVKKDLTAYGEYQRSQQTPAEQAIAEATEQGKKAGIASERRNTAATLFRGALEAAGITGDDLTEMTAGFNPDAFLTEQGAVDTTKITNFAKRFSPAGRDGKQEQRRDFGAGRRGTQTAGGGPSQAREQAIRRGFIKSS